MLQDADYTIRRPADFDYNAAIAELEEQVRRKKHLTTQLNHFQAELARLTRLETDRREELDMENADVAALRRVSPAVILYTITGQKADKLAREEAEALAAAARYETVKRELEYAETRVSQITSELRRLGNCDRKLEDLMREKQQKRMEQDTAFAEETARLERTAKALAHELEEMDQALEKGRRVGAIIRQIMNQLDQAYDLGVTDTSLFRYRNTWGYLRDVEKHEHLDTAQALLDRLGQYLQEFAAELDDVTWEDNDIPAAVNTGRGTRALDLYFDNIFTDFAVRNRIAGSMEEMTALMDRIEPIVTRLENLRAAKEAEWRAAEEARKQFVRQS